MMAETAVETQVCKSCGADVREESLFCYNCGEAVAPTAPRPTEIAEPRTQPDPSAVNARPPLRSAASLRKHRRAMNREPLQIRWEQPEGPPSTFIIASIVLTAGAIVLLILALYLR